MKLSALAHILRGKLQGKDADFSRVVIDSRMVQSDDCFFAIKGDVFDGHDFLAEVAHKNAAVVIVDRDITLDIPNISIIRVANTKQALITLAKYYRAQLSVPVVGITGSCGKTTTRAFVENILKQSGNVLASQKSFNNDIGLPLTLFQTTPNHDFVVLEIGTNHPGEIAALTTIAKPTVSVITMIAGVHVEGFGSVDNIAIEKSDIYETAEIAIINADDQYAEDFKKRVIHKRVITFGIKNAADIMAKKIVMDANGKPTFELLIEDKSRVMIALPFLGYHNITNALAAAAVAFSLNMPIEKIKTGLETASPEYGRLNIKSGISGATVIDDSYNANPTSVAAAIGILTSRSKNAILVLGDMKELGETAESAHRDIGALAKQQGVKQLFCYGDQTRFSVAAFGDNAFHFSDQQVLIDALKPQLSEAVTVLVKGSNSMKMIHIVNGILK